MKPRLGKEKWLELREKGFVRFVILNGVLLWGGAMWVCLACLGEFWLYELQREVHLPSAVVHQLRLEALLFAAWLTFPGGAVWALATWLVSEWWYIKRDSASRSP